MSNPVRKTFSKGQMTRSANSGPAVMLMPPHIRETFMPNPPLKHIPPIQKKRRNVWTGMSQYLVHFERNPPPERVTQPIPKAMRELKQKQKREQHELELQPIVEEYRKEQRESGGIFQGMNCYNTLFVGRLAYEVTERKLLREFETFGAIKDIKLVKDNKDGKSRGYAFVEFEMEEDMKRAYRAADGMKIEGRYIVVDVERGHTVPSWLPRRLGGGLGGTRLGGKGMNVTAPGRFDPSRVEIIAPIPGGPPLHGMGRGGPVVAPLMVYGDSRGGGPGGYPDAGYRGPPGGPSPSFGRGRGSGSAGGGPDRYGGGSRDWDRGGGSSRYGESSGGDWSRGKRPRSRSRSPDRRHSRGRRY